MDNVTNIEPADNEERLLKGILEGDTETNIEPAGNKERLLKGILEKIGGGGGGGATSVTLAASGDNLSGDISLADLKTALSNGVVLLSFPTDGNADERVVAEYTDDSTNGLRIGVFSEDEYIVYSVVDDGSNGITLTVVSEKGLRIAIITPDSTQLTKIQLNYTRALMAASSSFGVEVSVQSSEDMTSLLNSLTAAIKKSPRVMIRVPTKGGQGIDLQVVSQAYYNDTILQHTAVGSVLIPQQGWARISLTIQSDAFVLSATLTSPQ